MLEHPSGRVIAVKYSGVYPRGAGGKQVAEEMERFLDHTLAETRAAGVVLDMTELDYAGGAAIRGLWTPLDRGDGVRPAVIVAAKDSALTPLLLPNLRLQTTGMKRFGTRDEALSYITALLDARERRQEDKWADGSPIVHKEAPRIPVPIPDISTQWTLKHQDTFDRETRHSVEAGGVNILCGLYELWKHTLHESVDDAGKASNSSFYLTWGEAIATTAGVAVDPLDNPALVKLKRWTTNVGEEILLSKLAELHFRFLKKSSRWTARSLDPNEESREILMQVDTITDPGQLAAT